MSNFDGATLTEYPDHAPILKKQLDRVLAALKDGKWHYLTELARVAECSTPSASARIRDLRKPKFGSYHIERTYVDRGRFAYRLTLCEVCRTPVGAPGLCGECACEDDGL